MKKQLTGIVLAGMIFCSFAAEIPLKPENFRVVQNREGFSADDDTITLTGKVMLLSKIEIPYVEGKSYGIKCEIKGVEGTPDNSTYVGFTFSDAQKQGIRHNQAVTVADTETQLIADVKPKDTLIMVKDASKWATKGAFSVAFQATEDKSDLPNHNISTTPVKSVQKAANGWKITLRGFAGRTAKAGELVREHRNGGYAYIAQAKNSNGIVNPTKKFSEGQVFAGTKYIKVVILGNWSPIKGEQPKLTIRNFSVTEE